MKKSKKATVSGPKYSVIFASIPAKFPEIFGYRWLTAVLFIYSDPIAFISIHKGTLHQTVTGTHVPNSLDCFCFLSFFSSVGRGGVFEVACGKEGCNRFLEIDGLGLLLFSAPFRVAKIKLQDTYRQDRVEYGITGWHLLLARTRS
jgi:hypothetical protein